MTINVEEFERAGELSQQCSWTDDELKLIIVATKLSLAFLSGKGEKWHLATRVLRQNLDMFEGFMTMRKKGGAR